MTIRRRCTELSCKNGRRCLEHLRFDVMWRGKRFRLPVNECAIPRMEPGKQRPIQSMEEARDWERRFIGEIKAGLDPTRPPERPNNEKTEIESVSDFLDAYFESMSGFATVGASVLAGSIEEYPASILFWRSFTQWLGGMGVIVLSVAVLSQLTQAGLRLITAETGSAPARLRPKVAQTARTLWGLYTALTALMVAATVPVLMSRHELAFGDALYEW
jgi:hypothetical protein